MTIQDTLTTLERLLTHEEARGPVRGKEDCQHRRDARTQMETHLVQVETALGRLRDRFDTLPGLPLAREIQWAEAVLTLPNLAFFELDTDGLESDANILRVLLLDAQAQVLFDTCVKPPRPIPATTRHFTGLSQEELDTAPTIGEVWPDLLAAVRGRYILSYNLDFDWGKLHKHAQRLGVDDPPFIGECLMQRSRQYLGQYRFPKLETLCRQLGFPLPEPPQQTALHRAVGQLHLVQAMAQAIAGVPLASSAAPEDVSDDDHPF